MGGFYSPHRILTGVLKFVSTAIVATALCVANAEVWTLSVPADHAQMPYYFSGTNCRASGIGVLTEPLGLNYITAAELYIGGELVVQRDYPPPSGGEPGSNIAILKAMFDSTHFANGTNVEVKFRVKDAYSVWRETTGQSLVKNRYVLYGRYDMEGMPLYWDEPTQQWIEPNPPDNFKAFPTARPWLQAMNYSVHEDRWLIGWSATNFVNALLDGNVVHIHTHGSQVNGVPYLEADSFDNHWKRQGLQLSETYIIPNLGGGPLSVPVRPQIEIRIGTGLPPYNSTGIPAVNLDYLDSCLGGVSNAFAEAFLFPHANHYKPNGVMYEGFPSPVPENQAQLAYAVPIEVGLARAMAYDLYTFMHWGQTVLTARDEMYETHQEILGLPEDKPGNFLTIYGDPYTRLHGVYQPNNNMSTKWNYEITN